MEVRRLLKSNNGKYGDLNEQMKKLGTIIRDPKSRIRQFLSGDLRSKILELLEEAREKDGKVYGFLYELNDPELIPALEKLGKNMHLILANGSPKPKKCDQNKKEREHLQRNDKINLYDRIVKRPHLAHHKFLVICDRNDNPQKVWTGSTNWTVTGLCTQANNGLLIENPGIASWFKRKWEILRDAENLYPRQMKTENSTGKSHKIKKTKSTTWFAPLYKEADLEHARKIIRNAKQGILFLFFIPGPKKTLLNEIVSLRGSGLFIHGVANQDPSGNKNPVLDLYDRGTKHKAPPIALIPAAIDKPLSYWRPELRKYSIAMVHSKVVIVDPFGSHPVVMTGSHNLGPKASNSNDDNLVIIENAPRLAAEYAVNILSIYNQYKWRYNVENRPHSRTWEGLKDNDSWQNWLRRGPHWNEVKFWIGEYRKLIPKKRNL